MKEIKEWWFSKKIEDLPLSELSERIKEVMELKLREIVVIPYVGWREEIIEYRTDELIALCPATGYPDIYSLSIKFIPNTLIPELKSLKFYYMEYLNLPISHEHLADKIYNDFNESVNPKKLYLELKVARRGGIDTFIYKGEKFD